MGAFILVVLILSIWFFNQHVTEGYIYSKDDSRIWVIELSDSETKENDRDEIMAVLKEKSSKQAGDFYDVPFVNKVLNTNFDNGQKVRIYWTGNVYASAPGQIEGTLLIVKIN